MPDFQIETEETEAGATLKLIGELDGATSDGVIVRFERALAAGCQRVTLNLKEVTFIDSAGLRAIILIQRRAAEREVSLVLAPPPAPILELLEITGLTERLGLAPQVAKRQPEPRFLERIDLELRRDPSTPARARRELRQAMEGRLSELELATAVLLASSWSPTRCSTLGQALRS